MSGRPASGVRRSNAAASPAPSAVTHDADGATGGHGPTAWPAPRRPVVPRRHRATLRFHGAAGAFPRACVAAAHDAGGDEAGLRSARVPPGARRQAGLTLIELAVTLVILGVIGILLVHWLGTTARERRHDAQRTVLQRADDALLGFAAIHGRLPCPAVDGEGREDCTAASVGRLPWRSLGLPDQRAGGVRYGVLRASGVVTLPEFDLATFDATLDADLAQRVDRTRTLQVLANGPDVTVAHFVQPYDNCSRLPAGDASCTSAPQLHMNSLDFCEALRSASLLPPTTAFVHTRREDAPTQIAGNVAYALALPDAAQPATEHTGASTAFHSPRRPSTPEYQDRVLAVGIDQLWTRLRCGDAYGPAVYAHANAGVAARLTTPTMHNHLEQLEVMRDLAQAMDYSADAGIVSAVNDITGGIGQTLDTMSETFETYGLFGWRVVLASTGIGAAIGHVVAAGVAKGSTASYLRKTTEYRDEFRSFPTNAQIVEDAVMLDARRADILGGLPDPVARDVAERFSGTAPVP